MATIKSILLDLNKQYEGLSFSDLERLSKEFFNDIRNIVNNSQSREYSDMTGSIISTGFSSDNSNVAYFDTSSLPQFDNLYPNIIYIKKDIWRYKKPLNRVYNLSDLLETNIASYYVRDRDGSLMQVYFNFDIGTDPSKYWFWFNFPKEFNLDDEIDFDLENLLELFVSYKVNPNDLTISEYKEKYFRITHKVIDLSPTNFTNKYELGVNYGLDYL